MNENNFESNVKEILNKKNGEIIITTFADFMSLYLIICGNDKRAFFRGQANVDSNGNYERWDLESTISRSVSISNKDNFLIKLTKHFLNTFKMNVVTGYVPTPIEVLSKMQHDGLPTLLIDFTNSFEKALWFAFSEIPKRDLSFFNRYNKIEIEEWKGIPNYFGMNLEEGFATIYIKQVEKNDSEGIIKKIDVDNLKKIDEIIESPNNISRAIAQNSYFILDNNHKDENIVEVKISHNLKKEIDQFLSSKMIDAKTIYPDEKGMFLNDVSYSEMGDFYRSFMYDPESYGSIVNSILKINHLIKRSNSTLLANEISNIYESKSEFILNIIESITTKIMSIEKNNIEEIEEESNNARGKFFYILKIFVFMVQEFLENFKERVINNVEKVDEKLIDDTLDVIVKFIVKFISAFLHLIKKEVTINNESLILINETSINLKNELVELITKIFEEFAKIITENDISAKIKFGEKWEKIKSEIKSFDEIISNFNDEVNVNDEEEKVEHENMEKNNEK